MGVLCWGKVCDYWFSGLTVFSEQMFWEQHNMREKGRPSWVICVPNGPLESLLVFGSISWKSRWCLILGSCAGRERWQALAACGLLSGMTACVSCLRLTEDSERARLFTSWPLARSTVRHSAFCPLPLAVASLWLRHVHSHDDCLFIGAAKKRYVPAWEGGRSTRDFNATTAIPLQFNVLLPS